MLTITPEASDAIRGILESDNIPDGSVLRISPQSVDGAGAGGALMVSVTDGVLPDDEVVKDDEITVSVDATAAPALADKELDATVEGTEVTFQIGDQEEGLPD